MKPYLPEPLPLTSLNWSSLIRLVGQANASLASYDGILQGIINPEVLLSPLTTQEAVLSSKIEGTQATLEEVLEFEASPERRTPRLEDIREIINYRKAMGMAVEKLKERPISLNFIRDIHAVLLDSVRGQYKSPGQFRTTQNWIGRPGCSIEEAAFVPPVPSDLMGYLSNFETYIHHDEEDKLVQLAVIHAQLEIIHPFLDGNGRVGRILIPLFLYETKLLSKPMFYLSAYLEANRDAYYDRLQAVSAKKDWDGWVRFFLTAIIEQAKNNSEKAQAILALYEKIKKEVPVITRSQYSVQAIDALFYKPIFTSAEFGTRSGIPKASAMRLLRALRKKDILAPLLEGSGRRAAILSFGELIEIVEGRKVVVHP